MGRPMAYSHNTIARLLTHEVQLTNVPVTYDKSKSQVEHYAFARPDKVIMALWIGVRTGGRSEYAKVMIEAPANTGLVLAVDMTWQ